MHRIKRISSIAKLQLPFTGLSLDNLFYGIMEISFVYKGCGYLDFTQKFAFAQQA
jgi:hypothetical protein